jgi:hypothetical protein
MTEINHKVTKNALSLHTSTTGFATTSYTRFCEENSVSTSSNSYVSDSQLFLRSFNLLSFITEYHQVRKHKNDAFSIGAKEEAKPQVGAQHNHQNPHLQPILQRSWA